LSDALTGGSGPGDIALGVLTVDQSLTVRTWSDWLARVSGISARDACGRPLQEVLPDLERRGLLDRFTRVLRTGEAQVLAPAFHKYLIPCPPAAPSPHFQFMQQMVTLGPLRENDRIAGVMATIEDVTARLDAERAIAAELHSQDPEIRARAVARIGAAAAGAGTPASLAELLRGQNWQVRRGAVHGIARHASSGLVSSLIAALREEHHDFNVLSSALQLLAMIDVDVTRPLAELLRDPDPDLRIQAAHALGEQASPEAIPPLVAALDDPDPNVRFHAIESLGRLQSAEAVDSLAAIAESRDFFLAFPAVEALARIDDPRVAPRLAPLLEDDALCAPVAEALGRLGDGDMTRALVAVLDRPNQAVTPVASAVFNLHTTYERRYGGGAYIVSEFQAAVTPAGGQRLLQALRTAEKDELRGLVVLLGWIDSPGVGAALAEMLGRRDVGEEVMEALVRHGSDVVETVIEQLKTDDDAARLAAVVALGRLGDTRATAALTNALDDERAVAVAAADALASIGDPRAFEPLLARVGHPNVTVRQAVIAALNSIGHPEMQERIAPLLHSPDPATRESAVRIAGYFGYAGCADAVFERCGDDNERVRRAALENAPYLGESRALPVLLQAIVGDTPGVRGAAATALGQIAGPASRDSLVRALTDPDPWVRYYATRALGVHRDEETLDALGAVATADPAPHVRIAALQAIGAIDGARAAALLLPHTDDPEPAIAAAALASLGCVSDARATAALGRALRADDPVRRRAAIAALGECSGADSVASLRWAAESDASLDVAEAALDGIARIARGPRAGWMEAVDALVDLTAETTRRSAAIDALVRVPAGRVDRVARGLGHPMINVRRATIETLTRMKHPDASARVRAALDHTDPVVREAAVIALDRIGARGLLRKLATMANADPSVPVRRAAALALARYPGQNEEGGLSG
jgi:HEAT repeat protein